VERDGGGYGFDLGKTRRNIFLEMRVDTDLPVTHISP
jgi:hypothetical protein